MTTIELIIAISIISIITGLCFMKLEYDNYKIDAFVKSLCSDIRYVRRENMMNNPNVYIKFINENNDTVTIDMSESGSLHQPTGVTGTSETTIREGTVNLSSGHLNVRSSPNGEIIDLLDNTTRLEIIEYNPNGWSKIKLEDGTEAYVYSKYLKV